MGTATRRRITAMGRKNPNKTRWENLMNDEELSEVEEYDFV